jgi:tetratricopeptide (TPR) repeat protein
VLIAMGSIYQHQGDFGKAAASFSQALEGYTKLGDKRGMASGYGSLGNVYKAQGDYRRALEYQLRALALFEQLPQKDLLATNLKNIGDTYYEQQAYRQALAYYFRAARLAGDLGSANRSGENMLRIGKVYLALAADSAYRPAAGNNDSLMPPTRADALAEADGYLSRAITINSQTGNLQALSENYQLLAGVAELKGDYRRALSALAAHKQTSDSALAIEQRKAIANLQAQNAIALKSKQQELDQLAAAKKRNEGIFFGVGAFLLLAFAAMAYRRRRGA